MLAQSPARPQTAEERALERAHAEGTEVLYHEGTWYASSSSRPMHWYQVSVAAQACECEGSRTSHHVCKHLAMVNHVRRQPCQHCGSITDTVRRWVRVHDTFSHYVTECKDKGACARRQDRQAGYVLTPKGRDLASALGGLKVAR